jgi:single-strand DNA-binding protein
MRDINVNIITLSGRLTERPGKKETETGTAVAEFSLQTTHRWEEPQPGEKTEYWPCHAVGYPANSVCKYGRRGVEVVVVGRIEQRSLPCEDGGTDQQVYIRVEAIGYLSPEKVAAANGKAW